MVWIEQESCSSSLPAAFLHMPSCFGRSSSSTNIDTWISEKLQRPVISRLSFPQCLIENAYGWWWQYPPVRVKASWQVVGSPLGSRGVEGLTRLQMLLGMTHCPHVVKTAFHKLAPKFQIRLGITSHKSFCHLSAPVVSLPLWHNDHCVLLICCHKTRRDWAYVCELGKVQLLSVRRDWVCTWMHQYVINHIIKQIKITLEVVIKGRKIIREWDSECLERAEGLQF